MLNAMEILAVNDRRAQKVDVPEWGDFVYVRAITAEEREALAAKIQAEEKKSPSNIAGVICAFVISDDQGNRIFTDAQAAELGKKNASALQRIAKAANALNGLGADQQDAAAKNS
jgi:hypothetical protein